MRSVQELDDIKKEMDFIEKVHLGLAIVGNIILCKSKTLSFNFIIICVILEQNGVKRFALLQWIQCSYFLCAL